MNEALKHKAYALLLPPLRALAELQDAIVGLSYHRFESAPRADPKPGMAVTPATLDGQLAALGALGRFVSLDEALAAPRGGGLRFVLSFDDGYRDNATHLLPVLRRHGAPCVLYVVAGFAAGDLPQLPHDQRWRPPHPALTAEQLRELAADPLITVGSHTMRHARLADLAPAERDAELRDSKAWLEQVTGRPVVHFAAPFGQPADVPWRDAAAALAAAGYRSLASNFGGVNRAGRIERAGPAGAPVFHWRRVPMPNTQDVSVAAGWALGLCNPRERFRPAACLAPPPGSAS